MKIIYISDSILPSKTANSVHVMNMCNSLAEIGHEVLFIAVSTKQLELKNVDNIFSFYGIKKTFNLKIISALHFKNKILNAIYRELIINPKIKKILKNHKPDIVYGRQVFGCYIAAKTGFPVILESHAPMWEIGPVNNLYFNKLIKHKNFVRLIVITEALKNIYRKKNYNIDDIAVLPDASVPVPDFSHKIKLNSNSDNLKIMYTGHLYPGRGTENIIYLAEQLPEHDFYIVGGLEKDIDFWKSKSNFKNLHFLGFIPPAEVYKYRNSADILLAPYQKKVLVYGAHETSQFMSPLKIFEYMSSKKPVICSDLPVLREILNENNAILVPPDDYESWKNAVIKLAENPSFGAELANNSYNDFLESYTWDKRAEILTRFSLKFIR
ncbi:MAG: glycosyltransferase family 4 protein [Bacteroidales bacterium]|nr:glycosyltransferase family 4 protein [Bacteroidales bacterium]